MKCPECKGTLLVLDSKKDDESVQRRRKCQDCGRTVYTCEVEAADEGRYFHVLKSQYDTQKYCERLRGERR